MVNYTNLRGGLRRQAGITLIELLIAAAILASILVVVERSISGASKLGQVSEQRSEMLLKVDGFWVLLENDLRNVVAKQLQVPFEEPLAPMRVDITDVYPLMLLRAGQANPLSLPRTEVLRVAYRLEDEHLWRDSWINPYRPEEETARKQSLLENVKDFSINVLPRPPVGRSFEDGPWLEQWPAPSSNDPEQLPLAIEIKFTHETLGEIKRVIALVPGK